MKDNKFKNKVDFDAYLKLAQYYIELIKQCNYAIDTMSFSEVQYMQRSIFIKEFKRVYKKLNELVKKIESSYYINYFMDIGLDGTVRELKANGLI